MGMRLTMKRNDRDSLGPGSYQIKAASTAPNFSLAARFDGDAHPDRLRRPQHLMPRPSQAPGPGAYDLPSCVKVAKPLKNPTFGNAKREWSDLPKDSPAPNQYKNIVKHTETSYAFSIPKAVGSEDNKLYKESLMPGPGAYKINRDLQGGLAKSILGGTLNGGKELVDNGVPGPGTHNAKELYHPPGFRIVPHTNGRADKQSEDHNGEGIESVGPQTYNPNYPTHTMGFIKIGTGTREDPKPSNYFAPAPTTYDLLGQFEKAKANPKFHMGIKVGARGNKNFDQPGPGEYETDVAPLNNTNVAHVVGTSLRSDLGVGKAHLFPGPGEYEVRPRFDGPLIGFGTEMKKNKLKKTFEPGPGTYEIPSTIGHLPKHVLMTSAQEKMNASASKSPKGGMMLM